MNGRPKARDVIPISTAIRKLLHEHPDDLQGAVLAHVLAIWVAAHRLRDGADPTEYRSHVLHDLMETVARMVPLLDAMADKRRGDQPTKQ